MSVGIIRFGRNPPAPDTSKPGKIIAGDPTTTTRNYFTDVTGSFFSGVWESTAGKWAIDYTENEFVYLVAGRVRLTAADGTVESFEPGSAFVIPAGFKGSWESLDPVRKYYAVFEKAE
jgi:uncharacterized protein